MKDKVIEDEVVVVEILPISEITNVKAAKSKPKPEPKQEVKPDPTPPKPSKPEPEKPKPVETPKPPEPKEEKKPEIKESVVKPLEKPKEVKKEEPKKEEKKPEKKKEEDPFDALVKNLEKSAPEEKPAEKKDEPNFDDIANAISKNEVQQEYKPSIPMSISEKDAIKKQVADNWTVLAGAKDAKGMIVTLKLSLAQDGTVKDVKIENQMRYNTDMAYKAMADSAVRAAYKASPLKGLPVEKYQGGWDEIELNFDPSEMLY
jgi:hypothetical protein